MGGSRILSSPRFLNAHFLLVPVVLLAGISPIGAAALHYYKVVTSVFVALVNTLESQAALFNTAEPLNETATTLQSVVAPLVHFNRRGEPGGSLASAILDLVVLCRTLSLHCAFSDSPSFQKKTSYT